MITLKSIETILTIIGVAEGHTETNPLGIKGVIIGSIIFIVLLSILYIRYDFKMNKKAEYYSQTILFIGNIILGYAIIHNISIIISK